MVSYSEARDLDDAMMEADECIREWRELNDPDYFEGGDDVQESGEVHEEEDTSVLDGNKEAEDENL